MGTPFFSMMSLIFLMLVTFLLVILILMFAKYNKIANAVIKTIDDDKLYIQTQNLVINDHLTEPILETNFNIHIARYASDLIARIQVLFSDKHRYSELSLPNDLQAIKIFYYNNKEVGYIAISTKNQIYIVFRGTVSKNEWRHDLQFKQDFIDDTEWSCHSGFLHIYSSFKKELIEVLSTLSNTPRNILITGYSLGGALATISSLHISQIYPNKYHHIYVYVFGCPRVCKYIPPIVDEYWRVNNTEDIIKDVPLAVMPNLIDVKNPFKYTHGGHVKYFTNNLHSHSKNHYLQIYIDAMDEGHLM